MKNNIYVNMKEQNKWVAKYFDKDLVTIDELLSCIEDLDVEKDVLQEKVAELEKEIKDLKSSKKKGYIDPDIVHENNW